MTKRKQSSRIVIDAAGSQREICSFHLTSDGTINFRIRLLPELSRIGLGLEKPLRNHHVSIHPSGSSETFLVKITAEFLDETTHEAYVNFPKNCNDQAVSILFLRSSTLDYSGFDHKPRAGDSVVSLGSLDQSKKTLLLYPIFCGQNFDTSPIEHFCNKIEFPFERFKLAILWTFLNVPSIPIQSFHHPVAKVRLNRDVRENFTDAKYAVTRDNLLSETEKFVSLARDSYLRRAFSMAKDAGISMPRDRFDWFIDRSRELSKHGE